MYNLDLAKTFFAVKYKELSFILLMLVLIGAFASFFLNQSVYSKLNRFLPSAIQSNLSWFTLEVNNKYGVKADGFSQVKAQQIIEASESIVEKWFITLEDGKSTITLFDKSYEVYPQLYFNDAPSLLNIKLHIGHLPNKNDSEILISYDFWQDQLSGLPDIINQPIDYQGSKFYISGITQKGFDSFFLNKKFDVFVDAKQWVASQDNATMFWQIILFFKPINLGIALKPHNSPEKALSQFKLILQNLGLDNHSSIALFPGLVGSISESSSLAQFAQLYYFISVAILILTLSGFLLYQSMVIIHDKKGLTVRYILGEGEYYIIFNQFIHVFLWLMLAVFIGLIVVFFGLKIFKESSFVILLHLASERLRLLPFLGTIFLVNLFIAFILGFFAIVVIKQKISIIKSIFLLLTSVAMVVTIGLFIFAWVNILELEQKFNDKMNFQTENIYQWIYEKEQPSFTDDSINDDSNPHKELEKILLKRLNKTQKVESVLVSNVTPIYAYNFKKIQDIDDTGNISSESQYFANVSASYFDFFKISIVNGEILSKNISKKDILINETMSEQFGGSIQAVNKVNRQGERIVAVVKDAHFLTGNMASPPFKYYLNNKSQRFIILIKGTFDRDYLDSIVKKIMKEYHADYLLKLSGLFNNEYKKFFSASINRIKLLSFVVLTIIGVGLFSIYSGTIQWIEMNKKKIAIKFALGLTENKLWFVLTSKTFVWLLLIGMITYFMIFFLLPIQTLKAEMLLQILGIVLILITLSISVIYRIVLMRLNNDFITQVL